jgi:hypothetical protein
MSLDGDAGPPPLQVLAVEDDAGLHGARGGLQLRGAVLDGPQELLALATNVAATDPLDDVGVHTQQGVVFPSVPTTGDVSDKETNSAAHLRVKRSTTIIISPLQTCSDNILPQSFDFPD